MNRVVIWAASDERLYSGALDWLTPFATMSYVEGRDYTRNFRGTGVFDPATSTKQMPLPGSFSKAEPLPAFCRGSFIMTGSVSRCAAAAARALRWSCAGRSARRACRDTCRAT